MFLRCQGVPINFFTFILDDFIQIVTICSSAFINLTFGNLKKLFKNKIKAPAMCKHFGMKMKSLSLILLTVLSLGCTQTPLIESKEVDSAEETKAGTLPPKRDEKNKPKVQHKLAAVLYQLTNTSEPEQFAKQISLPFLDNKVKVFIYFTPESLSDMRKKVTETHRIQVEKASNDLVSAWVPVDRLIPLSKEPVIRFISPPKTLIKTNGKIDD